MGGNVELIIFHSSPWFSLIHRLPVVLPNINLNRYPNNADIPNHRHVLEAKYLFNNSQTVAASSSALGQSTWRDKLTGKYNLAIAKPNIVSRTTSDYRSII